MPRKDLNTYNNLRDCIAEQENEPEEGEIVDDCELIVSSDEELCMRQRIRELEAENEEIEQIAVISRSYVDEFNENRAARIPTDVSSISSTEFVTPKKRKRRKSKERKRKHCHHHHNHQHQAHHRHDQQQQQQQLPQYNTIKTHSHPPKKTQCKRRQKINAKKHNKLHSDRYIYKEISNETANLYSPDSSASSSSSSLTDTEIYNKNSLHSNRKENNKNYDSFITRDTLRLAVARRSGDARISTKKSCLKDKLIKQELVSHHVATIINNKENVEEEDDGDDDIEVIEPEVDIQTVDEDSSDDSIEEKELRLIALKSAIMKKHMARKRRNAEMAYSPTDFDRENKLEDIDVVDLEENDACVIVSPEASPQLMILDEQDDSQLMIDCKPVDMDIANSDSEDNTIANWSNSLTIPTFSYASKEFAKQFQYNMYVHDIELPPPPPGVDDYEEAPPPPPCFRTYNAQMQEDMELENEELFKEMAIETTNHHIQPEELKPLEEIKQELGTAYVKTEIKDFVKEQQEEEEEEEALRALLLAKFQSPKNQKKLKQNLTQEQNKINNNENNGTLKKKPIESILKEAVKRLKVHTQTESFNEEETYNNYEAGKENDIKYHREEWKEQNNNNDSMISLSALRKRSIELRNQKTQLPVTQHIKLEQEDQAQFYPIKEENSLEIVKDPPETRTNDIYGEQPNSMEYNNSAITTNHVDILDITRRLQQIKDKTLNSKLKQTEKENSLKTNFEVRDDLEHNSTKVDVNTENDINTNIQSKENLDGDPKELTKHKIIKADFDEAKKVTTFKITISNKAALKADDSSLHNENFVDKTLIKENDEDTTKKSIIVNSPQMLNKLEEKKLENPTKTSETLPLIKTKALPTFTLIRTKKIVKPNKVINTNVERKTDSTLTAKNSKTELLSKTNDKNRLITSFDQVKHMCKIPQFVISVQNSSNESSEDEWVDAYDALYKPLYDYNDIASPLSLNLESPCLTPTRSNSPIDITNNQKDNGFEEKLDKFLKTVRTNIVRTEEKTLPTESIKTTNKTPLAVRHLPAAAQSEYRRLIHRMKLLQNQRKFSEEIDNNPKTSIDSNAKDPNAEMVSDKNENEGNLINSAALKPSLFKQVLIRNANNNNSTTTETPANGSNDSQQQPKLNKTNVLRSYENIYVKIGAGIVNHLDKSLKLVEEAKKAKISKLKLESRLKELKAEMDILQSKHKEEQQKISRIYPNICTTNDVISSLKQKRAKVFKAALSLGKTLKGEEYRLNNELKESIATKTKKLATTIKLVNSLKAQDINNIEDLLKINTNKEQIVEENNEMEEKNVQAPEEEEPKSQQNEEKKDETNPLKENAITEEEEEGNPKSQLKENEENKDETTSFEENTTNEEATITKDAEDSNIPTTQLGGNTEFQNGEPVTSGPKELTEDKDCEANENDAAKTPLCSYVSPLEHLRNMDSNMDPNGVVCPYDLMGNCEDANCKYVHISPKVNTKVNII